VNKSSFAFSLCGLAGVLCASSPGLILAAPGEEVAQDSRRKAIHAGKLGGYKDLTEAILMCEPQPITCANRRYAVIGDQGYDSLSYWGDMKAKRLKRPGMNSRSVRIILPAEADRLVAKGTMVYGYMLDRFVSTKRRMMVVVGPRSKSEGDAACRVQTYAIEFRQGRHHCSTVTAHELESSNLTGDAG
jgi:hypothetical protein